jgi:SAM-dependent methyltransferase
MEPINCIFCDAAADQIAIRENGFIGRKCDPCGLIFISPRPSLDEMLNYYSAGDGAANYAGQHAGLAQAKQIQARHTLRLIRQHHGQGALLELGAGAGYFLSEAKKHRFEVFAIEPGQFDADSIREQQIPCETDPLHDGSFAGRRFNVVYHCDLLSHLHDPIAEFKQIHDKLDEGGLLVFETGNIAEIDERYYPLFSSFQYPEHLFFFGERSIRALLSRTGFECVAIHRYSITGYLQVKKLLRRCERAVESPPPAQTAPLGAAPQSSPPRSLVPPASGPKQRLRNLWHTLEFLVKYNTGWISPRLRRDSRNPQTLLVIARKR